MIIDVPPQVPFTFSQMLYAVGIILFGLGFAIVIKGIKDRSKSRPKRE